MSLRSTLLTAVGISLSACHGATPQHASMFGQVDVTFAGNFSSLGAIQQVVVGGIQAYAIRATDSAITVTLQGAPTPGEADVEIVGSRGRTTLAHALAYDPPAPGVPLKWVAFGASLSAGTESEGIDVHTQTYGFAAQTARAAGVYLGLPLFASTFVPPMQPSDFNADCSQKPGTGNGAQSLFTSLTDPATNMVDLRRGRIDPTLAPRNIAVGGATIDEVVHGCQLEQALFDRVIEAPDSPADQVFDALPLSELDRLEQMDADVGICTDLLANDVDSAVMEADDLHPEKILPVDKAAPLLQAVAARLGKLHGQYFIANMPSLTFLPNVSRLRTQRLAAGQDTDESFNAKLQQIDQLTAALNDALTQAFAAYPNIHIVDFRGYAAQLVQNGEKVGSEVLYPVKFGGLLSLDNLHFTDTGYAILANLFVAEINKVFNAQVPPVDVVAVHARDALSASVLRAAGLECAPGP